LKCTCSAYALALVQIGTGNAGPPGSEELEIDVDMSTMDLRLKRSAPLPRIAAPLAMRSHAGSNVPRKIKSWCTPATTAQLAP
jgi:hypothetical protein